MGSLKKTHQETGGPSREIASSQSSRIDIHTPYDDLIPKTDESSIQFYIDVMRIYLGLYEGTLTMEDAVHASEALKAHPEFAKFPTNPTLVPLTKTFKDNILSNLGTLKKFNLVTKDSVKSAISFAFVSPPTAISPSDFQVLLLLEKDPMCTLVDAAAEVGVTPRTIARSIERLQKNLVFRVSALMDMTAFGAQPFILFFKLAEGIEWDMVEEGFALYPFTKNILKTTMTDLGYISFLIPGPENIAPFTEHVSDISAILFDYSNLHLQEVSGSDTNLGLMKDNEWSFSEAFKQVGKDDIPPQEEKMVRVLKCQGWQGGLTVDDFNVISFYRNALRDPPRVLVDRIRMQGMDYDSKQVAQSVRKGYDRKIIKPFTSFRGVGLTTNFCFEIICDKTWKDRIQSAIVHLPAVIYFVSPLGIIVWAQVPSEHQVEYYQLFRSLESHKGVKSVNPIMTIDLKGSRSELDLTKFWRFGSKGWTTERERLNLSDYFDV
ncbi:MAG: MarR family transcriptional regulator [Candidatus Thorarchaeota archaeon]